MSIVVFERSCPKCKKGIMKYVSKTKVLKMGLVVTYYIRFVCSSCYYREEVI